ncbi:MAG TPA: peptidoglycan DD-metalloendopeptidase family protein [Roseiflexaceae bacterium]|nr:peptidoglycan DD-metalloendopeptidase family protein [Roseiflexaceae bacterium]
MRRQLAAANRSAWGKAWATSVVARLSWLGFISQALRVLRRRELIAAQAATDARSILENTPPMAYILPRLGADAPPNRAWIDRLYLFSPRFAAHAVTIGIVLLVTMFSAGVRLDLPVGLPSLRFSSTAEQLNDVRIERQIVAVQEPDAGEHALSSAASMPAAAEPAFVDYHTLAEGETLADLAARYHVDVASIFWANDLLASPVFAAGQELRIPRLAGVPHVIEQGETLEALAAQFQVRPEALVLFAPNGIRSGMPLPVGREIFVPGGVQAYPEEYLARQGGAPGIAAMRAVAAGMVQESETTLRAGPSREYQRLGYLDAGQRMRLLARHGGWVKVDNGVGTTGWVRADLLGLSDTNLTTLPETNDFPPAPPRWVWPTRGALTSGFGWRRAPWRMFHDGLDIANDAGTKIYAASAGQVYQAGWCSGFGYCVKLDHGNGITTIYGHLLRRPPVRVGDSVSAGDLIGLMGSTYDARGGGYSTGVHLHFTIKVNGKAVNPLKFLP